MKHNYLTYDQAHSFVDNAVQSKSRVVYWDSWDIVIWNKAPGGYMVKNGQFLNGQWGTTRRVKVTDKGTWRVPAL